MPFQKPVCQVSLIGNDFLCSDHTKRVPSWITQTNNRELPKTFKLKAKKWPRALVSV